MFHYDRGADRLASMSFQVMESVSGSRDGHPGLCPFVPTETMRYERTPWHLPVGEHALP